MVRVIQQAITMDSVLCGLKFIAMLNILNHVKKIPNTLFIMRIAFDR